MGIDAIPNISCQVCYDIFFLFWISLVIGDIQKSTKYLNLAHKVRYMEKLLMYSSKVSASIFYISIFFNKSSNSIVGLAPWGRKISVHFDGSLQSMHIFVDKRMKNSIGVL